MKALRKRLLGIPVSIGSTVYGSSSRNIGRRATAVRAPLVASQLVWFAVLAVILVGCQTAKPAASEPSSPYPATRKVDAVDVFHGARVPDPYRWLESPDDPREVDEWTAAQTALARAAVADPMRAWFADRLTAHAAGWGAYGASAPPPEDRARIRLERAEGGERQRVVSIEPDGAKRVIADPGAERQGWTVTRVRTAPDGAHVAVESSAGGSEWTTTEIYRVVDGKRLEETLDGLRFEPPIWTRDGRGFFYVWYGRPAPGESVAFRNSGIRYHVLGTPQSADRVIWSTPADDAELLLTPTLAPGGRYFVFTEGTGAYTDGLGQLLARLVILDLGDPLAPELDRQPALVTEPRAAGYRLIGEGGDGTLHVLTDYAAPRRRVVAIDPASPDAERWRELIPEHEDLLERVVSVGERYVAHYLRDAQSVVRVYARDGRLERTLDLPSTAVVFNIAPGRTPDELVLSHFSFLNAPTRLFVDLATGTTRSGHVPPATLQGEPYQVSRVRYPSRDGVQIPMFIVHRKGLTLDGSHPVLMHGYGASHTPSLPQYDPSILAWLEAGGVYALPNLRGGGEFGRDWWEAAVLERKQTTFDDFIAAAEYLVRERWTTPARLAIQGVSFGGLLVTAAMTERPDLFAAVVAEVPVTDLVRHDLGRHRAQMGSPDDPAQFPFVLRHSPLHRIRDGECYPATFITTSVNDERVPAWAAFKFAAALQDAQSCDRPVLLRVDTVGGHAGMTRSAWEEHVTDWLTFIARALGVEPMTPKQDG